MSGIGRELIRKYAHVHTVLSDSEKLEVQKLAEIIKMFSKSQAEALVESAAGRPVLCSYSNDGTPLTAKQRITSGDPNEPVVREGGDYQELLVQRIIYRYMGGGGVAKTAVMIRDPTILKYGEEGRRHLRSFSRLLQDIEADGACRYCSAPLLFRPSHACPACPPPQAAPCDAGC